MKKAKKDVKNPNTKNLNDGTIVKASCVHKKDTKMFKIQDIDLNKIKTSKKKFYSKPNNGYKHYVVYDYNGETIPSLIKLPEMIGRYKVFKDGKTMNFTCDNEKLLKNMKKYLTMLVTK